MHKLITANVKRSLQHLVEGNPWIPDDLMNIKEARKDGLPNLAKFFAGIAVKPLPNFYYAQDGKLQSPQKAFFGVYALRNVIRGILLGVRTLESGILLEERGFVAGSVFSFYSCTYHLLSSVLALNGRVWVEKVLGLPIMEDSSVRYASINVPCVVARLTKNNHWLFEQRKRSHAQRWDEIRQANLEDPGIITEEFLTFFCSITRYGPYKIEDEQELITEGLKRAAEARHEAVYAGFGFDDFAYDEYSEGVPYAEAALDLRARAFRTFSLFLLRTAVDGFQSIKAKIPVLILQETRPFISYSVYTPPLEDSDFGFIDDEELTEDLRDIQAWLLNMSAMAAPADQKALLPGR